MFRFLIMFFAVALMVSCGNTGSKEKAKEVAAADEGWEILFDGTSTDAWRGYGKETFPEVGWVIEDGTLKVQGSGRGEAGGGGGDIITKKKYGNFELQLEWKVSEGGNSGIFYLAQEVEGDPIYMSSPEMQILDNEGHPDAILGIDGNRKAGSLYDLVPAVPQNSKPAGEWNHVKIIVFKGTVVHWMNGEQCCWNIISGPTSGKRCVQILNSKIGQISLTPLRKAILAFRIMAMMCGSGI